MKKRSDKIKKILFVTLTPYDRFLRVQRMAKTLVEKGGAEIHVLSPAEKSGVKTVKNINGIYIHYVPVYVKESGMFSYIISYALFFVWAFIYGTYLYLKNKFDTIYVVNHPDFLVFCFVIPKIFGVKIVLDIRDPMLEIFSSKFGESRVINKLLVAEEKLSVRFSDKVITVSNILKKLICKRDGVDEKKVFVVYNAPYKSFRNGLTLQESKKDHEKITITYVGAMRKDRGIENLIHSLEYLDEKFQLLLVGDGDYLPVLKRISRKYKNRVIMVGRVLHDEVKKYLARSDILVVQFKSSPINYIGTPGKLFEYMAYEKPVLVPRFPGIMDILGDDYPFFFDPDNPKNIALAISRTLKIFYTNENLKEKIVERYRKIFHSKCWNAQERQILKVFFD